MANIPHKAESKKSANPKRRHKVLVLHGPNLNLRGPGEPDVCAGETIATIDARLAAEAKTAGIEFVSFQSNHEDELIGRVRAAVAEGAGFIVIAPAGLTHTSVPLRAALSGVAIPFIEVHLSNVHAREPFRQRSHVSDNAVGTIVGLGAQGYELALTYALRHVKK
jgi:3-dehydroquinate dehydratase II